MSDAERLVLAFVHSRLIRWSFGVTIAFELARGFASKDGLSGSVSAPETVNAIRSLVRDGFLYEHELTENEMLDVTGGDLPEPGEPREWHCTYALTDKAQFQLEGKGW